MNRILTVALATLAAVLATTAAPLAADVTGDDAQLCRDGRGPAIQVNVLGLKDRAGEIWVELYPANAADFLAPDTDLLAQGKVFRRAKVRPASNATAVCIGVPHPGRYSLMVRHNRTGKDKFSFWSDGAGFPSNRPIGRNKPTLPEALITAGDGVTVSNVHVQYLRGLSGFAPI